MGYGKYLAFTFLVRKIAATTPATTHQRNPSSWKSTNCQQWKNKQGGSAWFSSQTGKAVLISFGFDTVAGVGHLLYRHFFSAIKYCTCLKALGINLCMIQGVGAVPSVLNRYLCWPLFTSHNAGKVCNGMPLFRWSTQQTLISYWAYNGKEEIVVPSHCSICLRRRKAALMDELHLQMAEVAKKGIPRMTYNQIITRWIY